MSDAAPDTLTVTEHFYDDLRSTGADVRIKVSERSLGARSSQRVAALRARLVARGFAEGEVMLEDIDHTPWAWIAIPFAFVAPIPTWIRTEAILPALAAAGAFVLLYLVLRAAKLGSVTATLKVRCADTARAGVAIDEALSSGAELGPIGWRYDVPATSAGDWAELCAARASARATRLAEALGVRIVGVHAVHEEHTLPQTSYTVPLAPVMAAPPSKARLGGGALSESLGAAPSTTQRAGLRLTVAYRVGAYQART